MKQMITPPCCSLSNKNLLDAFSAIKNVTSAVTSNESSSIVEDRNNLVIDEASEVRDNMPMLKILMFVSNPISQYVLKTHLLQFWPILTGRQNIDINYLKIYSIVRDTGLPNYIKARVLVPSGLNINAWRSKLNNTLFERIIDFLEFG